MKRIITILLIFFCFGATAQQVNQTADSIAIGRKPTSKIALEGSVTAKNFNGKRPITGSIATGQNPNTNDLIGWINSVFYPSQVPTAGLSIVGAAQLELHSPGTFEGTVNWSAGRQVATEPLATIVVDGVTKTFTQPSAGSNVGAAQGVTVTWNTTKTVTNTVTTTDSKTASVSTSWTFLPKRYWGRTSNIAATSAELIATSGGNSQLSNTKSNTFTVTPSGSNRVFYAYPSNLGNLTSLVVGGLESLEAFNKTVLSHTNASGYTQNYNVYTTINPTGGTVTGVAN